MTVSTAPTPLSYAGNGSTTAFPVTWKYNAKSHVVATLRSSAGAETVWAITTNYTLTDPGDTGTLTAVVAPATGQTLVITLEPPNTQSSDIPLGGDLPSQTIEDGLDLAAQRDGKIEALFLRALRVPKTDTQTGSSLELPIDSLRASKFLAFDASGDPIAAAGTSADLGPVSAFINTLLDDTTAAAARTTLGVDIPTSGLWSPSVGGSATYTAQVGLYTKIGSLVIIHCRLTISSLGTGSTNVITGAPFAALATTAISYGAAVAFWTSAATALVGMSATISDSSQSIVLAGQTAASVTYAGTTNILGNGTEVRFTLIYLT